MELNIHSFQKQGRLSVLQFSTKEKNTFEYITGPSAIAKNMVEVREVSLTGSVNNLSLTNLSDKYIFFMDGDILVGAKQNRVLNTSVFVAPNSNITIPVSCVEQGRWRDISTKFSKSDYVSPDIFRAKKLKSVSKNLRTGRGHFADQGEVWNEVSDYIRKLDVSSNTNDFTSVFKKQSINFDEFINQFTMNSESNGVLFLTDNSPLGIDIFNRTDVYQEYFPKRLRSTAIEIFNLRPKDNSLTESEAKYRLYELFDELEKLSFTVHNGVGVGKEKRYDNEKLVAMELSYNEHLIHFTLLNLNKVN